MKKIMTVILGSLFATSLVADAPKLSRKELVAQEINLTYLDENTPAHDDLLKKVEKNWNAFFDEKNLKDDENKHRTDWKSYFPITQDRTHEITGSRTYYGMVKKDYRYTIKESADENKLIVELKLHYFVSNAYLRYASRIHGDQKEKNQRYKKFIPRTGREVMEKVQEKLAIAEKFWNKDAPKNVRFKFSITPNEEEAHYSIKLSNSRGALYDKYMWALASTDTLTHEIGHMLGLDEEYPLLSSNVFNFHQNVEVALDLVGLSDEKNSDVRAVIKDKRCHLDSIMCHDYKKVYPYHYDHILGRIH